ncbi:MAG: OmcA/MtrC family decaheme c-type cytochrome [Gammaproteobacteria bacterium]
MSWLEDVLRWGRVVTATAILAFPLAGCLDGDDGDTGPAGPPGPPGPAAPSTATSLNMEITDVTIESPPVVDFSVTNQDDEAFPGLTTGDLRFTVAKLIPGSLGDPSRWQSYINTEETAEVGPGTGNTTIQATRENGGTLDDHGDGTYTYTFETDIANVTDPLAVPFDPTLTHRLAIQTRGELPPVNAVYTFRPSDGATEGLFTRDIVKTENCNECHNQLEAHDERIETAYCVTCHNPGSTDANSGNTVDFKVMVHKIHRGAELPSVEAGGEYAIWGFRDIKHDFSDVEFPQDIRNCTKCHTGEDPETPQGDNWMTQPSMEACGSCHDLTDFSQAEGPNAHPGGVVNDNSECVTCHAENRIAGSVAESHAIPEQLAAERFEYNLIDVSGGTTPAITFSITDPTNGDAPYDITSDPAFTTGGGVSRLAILVGWSTTDFNSNGSGSNPALPISINPVDACDGTTIDDWSCTAAVSGEYTLTKLTPLPAEATGTGRVGIEGHPAAPDEDGAFTLRVPVKSVVMDWSIDGSAVSPRREVVDIAKCDLCHEQLSLHGSNRNDEPQLCVICHNPNATDINVRPKTPIADEANPQPGEGVPAPGVDGKLEEAIDFKRLIHGIHGAEVREEGLVVYGFGGSVHDFSEVRFPGIVQDCETCHLEGTYELEGIWETPTLNGILASTVNSAPNATVGGIATGPGSLAEGLADQSDDLNISPTAAVCSSCHDSAVAQGHMVVPGGAVFDQTQQYISDMIDGNFETCAVCHGPGRDADVEEVHAVAE